MPEETGRGCLLLVDDDSRVRATLRRVLVRLGLEVTSVPSLNDALAAIQTEKFDALLTELSLPEAHSGFTAIEEMRRVQPGCINFILTGNPAPESFQRATRSGVAHFFIKPADPEEMGDVMGRKLTPHSSPATTPRAAEAEVKYSWQQAVLSAFMERHSGRLPARISAAERAIAGRLRDPTPASLDEQAALAGSAAEPADAVPCQQER